jgi:hypothetical protein
MMLLAYASHKSFTLFKMDVKSAFLNGFLDEEVYLQQHPDLLTKLISIIFIDSQKLYMVLNKPLELSMVDLVLFFFQMVLLGIKMILLS